MLGTLNSFRESEKEKLQDVGEGKFDLEIKLSEPQKLSEEMAQYLYSANTSRWFELGGEFSSENGAWVHRIRSAQSIPNCWVFCTSLASEDEDYGNITEEYSNFWTIDSKYIQSFATTLGQLLISQLSTVDLPEKFACDPLQDLFDRIKLEVQTGAVKYADSVITKDDLPNGEIPKTVESFLQFVAQRAIFTKPENFKKNENFGLQ